MSFTELIELRKSLYLAGRDFHADWFNSTVEGFGGRKFDGAYVLPLTDPYVLLVKRTGSGYSVQLYTKDKNPSVFHHVPMVLIEGEDLMQEICSKVRNFVTFLDNEKTLQQYKLSSSPEIRKNLELVYSAFRSEKEKDEGLTRNQLLMRLYSSTNDYNKRKLDNILPPLISSGKFREVKDKIIPVEGK